MITHFPSLADISLVYRLTQEYCRYYFPSARYKVLTTSLIDLDEVHLEVSERNKEWGDEVEIRAFVRPKDEEHPLAKFGLEQVRDVVLSASVPDLIEVGLVTQNSETFEVTPVAGIGDRFQYSGFEYDVLEVRRGEMFANTDIPIFYEFVAERKRDEADLHADI